MNVHHAVVIQSSLQVRERLERVLVQEGMRVTGFASALDFLGFLETGNIPDVLLVDLHLEGIDGWRLCRLLRAKEFRETNALPIIVTSSVFFDSDLSRIALALGANGCLSISAGEAINLAAVHACKEQTISVQRPIAMVVDDDEAVRSLVAMTLTDAGYDVVQAGSRDEARRRFEDRQPAVVVLDHFLSDGNALELLEEWQGRSPQTVIVVITGHPTRETAIEYARHGVDAYLCKPFEATLLEKTITNAWHERTLHGVEELLQQRTLRVREAEQRFRALYEQAPLGYHSIGPDGTILSMNATELQWLGYAAEEIVGRRTMFELQSVESVERGRAALDELKRVGAVHDVELVLVRKNGTPMPVSIEAEAVRNEAGRFVLSRMIVRDLTNRKEREAQLRQAQSVESISTLAEGIAHNFNNILTPVLINAGELVDEFPPGSETREVVEEIVLASKQAAGLIRQLAMLGRSAKAPFAPVDLRDLIMGVVGELRRTFERAIVIETEIAPGSAVATGNAAQLRQTLMALCFNAREAMPTGGILTIALSRTQRSAPACGGRPSAKVNSWLMLSVADTGAGVPAEICDRVFEPFFTTKGMAKHAGLGLSTTYSIMRNHGGYIEIDPSKSGAHFALYFPLFAPGAIGGKKDVASREAAKGERKLVDPPRRAGATILVVDDDHNIRRSASRVLTKACYTVLEANSGRACLNRVAEAAADGGGKKGIDLVLLDVIMPGMACEEVLDALRDSHPDLAVVIATGHGDELRINELLEHGARRIISKPFEKDRLLQVVRDILDARPEPL